MSLINERVLLKTPLNPSTGYGRDGILMADHLFKMGADIHLEPKYVGLPLPYDVANLFVKERPYHFDVAINHEYPGELGFPEVMPMHANKIVAWSMYEFLSFGDDNEEMTEKLAERLDIFDLILAYDDVTFQSFSEYLPDTSRMKILQGGYDAEYWKPREGELETREWDGTFRFCMQGTMNQRKNPWATIWAFKGLKDELGDAFDAELHLKTTSLVFPPQMEEWCPGLRIHYANWSTEDLRKFYLKMNCLVAPSWGEGKNLPALEAQTMGVPVAVSAFGGHMQWADEQWAYLLPGKIEEHKPKMGSFRVDADVLRETMLHIYENRNEAKQKGLLAARMIPAQCDWEQVFIRFQNILDRTPAKTRV